MKDMFYGTLFGLLISLIVQLLVIAYLSAKNRRRKRKIEESKLPYPECKLCDPNQCNIWCMAKERFTNNPPLD